MHVGTTLTTEYLLAIPSREPIGWLRRSTDPPLPDSSEFSRSYARFEEGAAAYRAREYDRAATLFLRAAQTITTRSGPYADSAARNRTALYMDAAIAWRSAGQAALGRATIDELEADGRARAEELKDARAVLDVP